MKKRILSLALVVMMLVSLVPAAFVTAGAEDTDVTVGTEVAGDAAYRFKLDFKSVSNVPELGLEYSTTESKNYADVASVKNYAMTKGMWKYYSSSSLNSGYNGIALASGLCPQLTYGGKAWVAIKFNVPAAGTYDIALDLIDGRDAGSYYIIPGNTTAANCFTVATGGTEDSIVLVEDSKEDTTVEGVALEEGEYILVQRGLSTQTGWTCPGITSITFTASGATEFAPLYYGTIYPVTVENDTVAYVNAKIYDAFTGAAYEGDVTYKVADENIATVDGVVVSGVKFGETTISAEIDGALAVITPAAVVVPSDETPYRFMYNFGAFHNVEDLGLALEKQTSDTAYYQAQSIKDYAMTNGAWKYYESKGISTAYNGMMMGSGIRCYSTGGVGSYLAFKLNVPVSGTYNVKLTTIGKSAQADYFLIQADKITGGLTAAMNSTNAIAIAEDFATEVTESTTASGIELQKGEYVFVYRADLSGWTVPTVKSLELATTAANGDFQTAYVGSIDPVEGSFEKNDTFTVNARVFDAWTGEAYEGDVTFAAADENVLSVNGAEVTVLKAGKATVMASLADAEAYIAPVKVTVINDETPYKFQYDFDKIYEREDLGLEFVYATAASDAKNVNPTSITDYAMTHGAWKYHSGKDVSPNYGGIEPEKSHYPYLTTTSGYIALELNVPVSGTFDINYVANTVSQASKLYLLNPGTTFASKADIIAAVDAGNGIVIDDNYVYTGGGYNKTIPEVSIEAGKYILALVSNVESGWCRFSLGTLTFSTTNPNGDFNPVYFGTVDPINVEGKGVTATATAHIYDAMAIDTEYEGDVTFAVEDEKIATVDGAEITAVNFGKTTLSAKINEEAYSIIPATLAVSSDETPYQFRYHFGKIYNVPEAGLEYGMQTGDKNRANVKTITDYAMTHGAWKHYASTSSVITSYGGLLIGTSLQAYFTANNGYLALKLNVPVSGTFDITLGFPAAGSAAANYYLIPGDTAIEDLQDAMAAEDAIVLAENHSSSGTAAVTVTNVAIEKGEYIFIYSACNTGWTQPNPATLTFKTSNANGEFNTPYYGSVYNTIFEAGNTAEIAARVYDAMNSDVEYDGEVTLAVDNSEVATLDGTTLTAVKPGKTFVTATIDEPAYNIIPGNVVVTTYGHHFKYSFMSGDIVKIPEIGAEPTKNGVEYTYDIRTVNDYASTKGMWKYYTSNGLGNYGGMTGNLTQVTPTKNPDSPSNNFLALKINVPVGGTFDVSFTLRQSSKSYFYLLPGDTAKADVGAAIAGEDKITLFEEISVTADEGAKKFTLEDFEIEAGEYILVMKSGYYGNMRPVELVFETPDADVYAPAYAGTVDPMVFIEEGSAEANARIYDAWTKESYEGDVTFAIDGEEVAILEDGVVTAVALGKTTLSATINEASYSIIPGVVSVEPKPINVTGITLDQDELNLMVGENATLTATVEPEDATNKDVVWASDNTDVATVKNGVVVAAGAGEATITATTVDGEFTAECLVTVVEEPEIFVTAGPASGKAGDTVDVPLTLSGNAAIANLQVTVCIPEGFVLTKTLNGTALADFDFEVVEDAEIATAVITWTGEEAVQAEGTLATLSFAVAGETEPGDYEIEVVIDAATDAEENNVKATAISGNFTVEKEYLPGDVDGSDKVDTRDIMLIRRHLAGGYNVTINEAAADVDASGKIDTRDIMLIRRYLAGGYNVELK